MFPLLGHGKGADSKKNSSRLNKKNKKIGLKMLIVFKENCVVRASIATNNIYLYIQNPKFVFLVWFLDQLF